MIPFNKPFFTGKETEYIKDAVEVGKISGNGKYTQKCQQWFEERYGFKKTLLTTSCTDALEMAAILIDIKPGDEVLMPSYTFVSTANAFVLRGAKIVFVDSRPDHPGMDESSLEHLITSKTKAIVPVHYAGVACDMDQIMAVANHHGLFVIEDAAQAIDSFYISEDGSRRPLGSIGHLAAFSFHETKNIISGEGGLLVINDERFVKRAEIIWEKGTNRSAFFRGEIDKYGWVDVGSSFLPSDMIAAFLWAQLENIEKIQDRRKEIWDCYNTELQEWSSKNGCRLPFIPDYSSNNAHMFYVLFPGIEERSRFIAHMKSQEVLCVFHYLNLEQSPFYAEKHDGRTLGNAQMYSDRLVRLPMFFSLQEGIVIETIKCIQIS